MNLIQYQVSLPSRQYGVYESSEDIYPDERRWAKRFALRKLRDLLRSYSGDFRPVVRDLRVLERIATGEECPGTPPYSYGWKCELMFAEKQHGEEKTAS